MSKAPEDPHHIPLGTNPSTAGLWTARSGGAPFLSRLGRPLAAMCLALVLGACATRPEPPPPPPPPAPKVEGLPEFMHQAEAAVAAGDKDKARDAYRSAARAEPTSKLPWLKLAESYFEGGDYGNAVLAAQEVLHRDASDGVAASILAVSGLRVSTSALTILRQQNDISPGTRGEAETLTQSLRDLLGEKVLVPRPEPSVPEKRRPRPRPKPVATASDAATGMPSPAPQAMPARSVPAATPGSNSPFDKLK